MHALPVAGLALTLLTYLHYSITHAWYGLDTKYLELKAES